MKRAYKYRLNPTPEQIVFFNKSFGCCRFVYNYMLGKRIEAYQRDKTKIGWVELAKMLTELKRKMERNGFRKYQTSACNNP